MCFEGPNDPVCNDTIVKTITRRNATVSFTGELNGCMNGTVMDLHSVSNNTSVVGSKINGTYYKFDSLTPGEHYQLRIYSVSASGNLSSGFCSENFFTGI